jgi:diadenosine tetraphosphate (Ap4A) HIT family hydrolase
MSRLSMDIDSRSAIGYECEAKTYEASRRTQETNDYAGKGTSHAPIRRKEGSISMMIIALVCFVFTIIILLANKITYGSIWIGPWTDHSRLNEKRANELLLLRAEIKRLEEELRLSYKKDGYR